MKYDYLVVGAGLFGVTFAQQANALGKKVIVIDKRNHVGGNVFTYSVDNIHVHKYGAHIFHTNNQAIWNYVNRFSRFKPYIHSPLANYHGKLYSLPINMYTFNQLWGDLSPQEVMQKIRNQQPAYLQKEPQNLEEYAIASVGYELYELLIKGYTQKQWGRTCTQLPVSILKRIPVRFTYNTNYFDDVFQGIPMGGYTKMIQHMLAGIDVQLNSDYLNDRQYWNSIANNIVYTGPIDAYFDYCFGQLSYRTLRFETEILNTEYYQNASVVNYTDLETPYTRIIEHKWFEPQNLKKTVITREYSCEWMQGAEPYYPINDEQNTSLYRKYQSLSTLQHNVLFGGRLGEYRYYNMDQVIASSLELVKRELFC